MEKIKINLTSGSALEKPLVTAFNSNNASYVVLDNEINGTMGLPIILVSKLVNNVLTKIEDQNEWNAVKESLRFIISGNQVDYITLQPEINANDMFFSQFSSDQNVKSALLFFQHFLFDIVNHLVLPNVAINK